MKFAQRLKIALPQLVPESVERFATILETLVDVAHPSASDREIAMAHLLQVFAAGRLRIDELRVLQEVAPAVIQGVLRRAGVGVLQFRQDCLRDGVDWRFIFNALIDLPEPPVAKSVAIPARTPKPDSAQAFCQVLIEMAREEMAAAAVHRDLAMIASGETGLETQETAGAHVARAEALLAGAQALWNQL